MKSTFIFLTFIFSLIAFVSSAILTVFGLITGRKYEEIRIDFEASINPLSDSLADFYLWLSGQPDQLISGTVWMLGIPLIASAVTGLIWFRFRRSQSNKHAASTIK